VTPARAIALLTLLVAGCPRGDGGAPTSPASAPPHKATPSTRQAQAASAPWTPERVRDFVLETHGLLMKVRGDALTKHYGGQAIGQCYGEPAYLMGKASDIVPVFEQRLTGRALACHLASYVGCRLGDSMASAGVSTNSPVAVPFQEAKAAIIEQTADRVVAEVSEAEYNMVRDGKLVPGEGDGVFEHKNKSRYTLTRDAQGVWKIADRVPSFSEWECREK
jgi:hypothetical protein